jgi:hypothetical protein
MASIIEQSGKAQSSEKDFDFLIEGDWIIKNRRLKEWLNNSNEWIEFTSNKKEYSARKILGGMGNLDEVIIERNGHKIYGMGIRLFNPKTNLWTIFWTDSAHPELGITRQVEGKFTDNVGEFFGEESFNGITVKLRFIWKKISSKEAYWEQAYYDEKSAKWEVNWTMSFVRPS